MISNFYENPYVMISSIIFLFFIFYVGCVFFFNIQRKINILSLIFLYSSLILISAFTKPYDTDDLTRYYYWINEFRFLNLSIFESYAPFPFLSKVILKFISFFPYNFFLQVFIIITILTVVFLILYLEFNFELNYKSSLYLLSLLAVLSLYISVSGIRFNLSISLSSIFLILLARRNISLSLYLVLITLMSLIHIVSAIFFLIILVKLLVYSRKQNYIYILPFIVYAFTFLMLNINFSDFPIIDEIQSRFYTYYQSNLISSSFFRNLGYFCYLFSIFLFLITNKENKGSRLLDNFILVLISIAFSTYIIIPELFYRLISIISLLSFSPIKSYFNRTKSFTFYRTLISYKFILFQIGIFILLFYEFINYYRDWMFYTL